MKNLIKFQKEIHLRRRISDRGKNTRNYPVRGAGRKKNEKELENLWDLLDTIKRNNIRIMGNPEEEKRRASVCVFKAITAKDLPNLGEKCTCRSRGPKDPK